VSGLRPHGCERLSAQPAQRSERLSAARYRRQRRSAALGIVVIHYLVVSPADFSRPYFAVKSRID
jgi:hypothetical protein